jgi:MFS family permease
MGTSIALTPGGRCDGSIATGLVFAKLYFPASDPLIGTMQAYVVFFVGFIARPIGVFIFGHYGDRIGVGRR